MNRRAWIDGVQHTLTPAALLGQGGEAEVYDLGDGRVLGLVDQLPESLIRKALWKRRSGPELRNDQQ